MIRFAVDIESEKMPAWAMSYLTKNQLLHSIQMIKRTKRKDALHPVLSAMGKSDHLNRIYCNSKGYVVFKWEKAKDKTMFLLEWS